MDTTTVPAPGPAHRLRILVCALALALTATLAGTVQPAEAYSTIGGQSRGWSIEQVDATIGGIACRTDTNSIGVNTVGGTRGSFIVDTWVWRYGTANWQFVGSRWHNDALVGTGIVGSAGMSTPSLYYGVDGWYQVHVRIRYADGRVVHAGTASSYQQYYFDRITGRYSWNNSGWCQL